jgi:hypothetical protein
MKEARNLCRWKKFSGVHGGWAAMKIIGPGPAAVDSVPPSTNIWPERTANSPSAPKNNIGNSGGSSHLPVPEPPFY